MHRKNTGRWVKLVSLILGATVALAGLLIQPVQAGLGNPIPICAGQDCTITFEYSGSPYLWVPPSGTTEVKFDLYGAQGGQGALSLKAGGLGGRISGTLTTIPTGLFIYVGGAGSRGPGAPGGYNGGGSSGSGHGDEGSGGGATDIRISAGLADRFAVAGGGGGTGGFNWSTAGLGGAGGGLIGGEGGWGQAAPGLGGSQSTGGSGGLSNGGSASDAGDFGVGGKGASSTYSGGGGGGGGGGYFGGGGGGADIDSCCFNGGGGGGGSNYAKSSSTASIQHSTGVRAGNGIAYIAYHWVPTTPTPTPTPSVEPVIASPVAPSAQPTSAPTSSPTASPESSPTPTPTPTVTPTPTKVPTPTPTPTPTVTPTPTKVPTPTPTPTLAQPTAQPSPSPVVSLTPVPVPMPVPTPVPVPVVEHLPSVTPASPEINGPSTEIAAPLPEPIGNSEQPDVSPVLVELVAHLAPPTKTSTVDLREAVVHFEPAELSKASDATFEYAEPAPQSMSSITSVGVSKNLVNPETLRARRNSKVPTLESWQWLTSALFVTAGSFAGWRRLRRKTPPKFARVS